MILTGDDIWARSIITPFNERTTSHGLTFGLGPAGYDVRCAEATTIEPGQFWLASTLEHFVMPNNVIAFVHDKSTWARRGLAVQNTVIEPGWRGYLTMEVTNHGTIGWEIEEGTPIAQIIFHFTSGPCAPYAGKYQDQGPGPIAAIHEDRAAVEVEQFSLADSFCWPGADKR